MIQSLLQSNLWADFKSRHGWQAQRVEELLFLERSLPFGQLFLYAPELAWSEASRLAALVTQVKSLAHRKKVFCVRLEFLEEWDDTKANELAGLGLIKAFEEVQPEYRQWLDLTPSEDAILAQMKPKGRYNIRLAQKHGVTVSDPSLREHGDSSEVEEHAKIFYSLAQETAARDGFAIRSLDYYADLIGTLQKSNAGGLFVARYHNQPIAAAIISFGPSSLYLHGASSHLHRDVMAPYALHWQIIQEANRRDCTLYDLLAIAPFEGDQRSEIRDQKKKVPLQAKYAGITRFKQQFGGRSVHLLGSWDLVLNPLVYAGFRILEQQRRR